MTEARELYQEAILDHYRKPRNLRKPEAFTHSALGYNPLCGDRVTVYLSLEDGVLRDVAFEGVGCAISTASASMMTEALRGKRETEAADLFERFRGLVTHDGDAPAEKLGKLRAFSGVREFPVRVKCASLPWHTLKAALEKKSGPVTTE